MRTNEKGMVALVDALIFVAVLMIALSVTVKYIEPQEGDLSGTGEFMDAMEGVWIRLSDVGGEDDTRVSLTDALAFSMSTGEPGAMRYLEAIASEYFGEGMFRLQLSFGGESVSIGSSDGRATESSEREFPISSGGTISIRTESYAGR